MASCALTVQPTMIHTTHKRTTDAMGLEGTLPLAAMTTEGLTPHTPALYGYSQPDYMYLQANKSTSF